MAGPVLKTSELAMPWQARKNIMECMDQANPDNKVKIEKEYIPSIKILFLPTMSDNLPQGSIKPAEASE